MTDELTDTDSAGETEREKKRAFSKARRTRVALSVILVALVLMLCGVSAFVLRLATPTGAPDSNETPAGLTWVRSIYGWGKLETQQLSGPSDVGIGPDGTIWVADSKRFQIVGFTPSGAYKALIKDDADQIFPQAFDVSADNELYVCDFAKGRVVVFAADGTRLREWEIPTPMEVAVRGNRVVVTSRAGAALFDTKGELIAVWGSKGAEADQFDVVRGAAIGPDGTIYLSDTQNHRVKAYDEKGELKWVYPTTEDFAAIEKDKKLKKPYQIPTGMTFDAAGRLLLVDPFEFTIDQIDTETGKRLKSWGEYGESDGKFAYPTSLDYDASRDWFAVADTANNRVQIVQIEGSGGGVAQAARRFAGGQIWVCAVPLALLMLALLLLLVSRRKARQASSVVPGDALGEADEAGGNDENLVDGI